MWGFNVDTTETWAYVEQAFTAEECDKIIQIGMESVVSPAKINAVGTGVLDKKIRKSLTSWISPNGNTEELYRKLTDLAVYANEKYFNFELFGLAEDLQFTRYEAPGGKYSAHIDKTFQGPIRKLSFSVILNDPKDYKGGKLFVQTSEKKNFIEQKQGRIVFFPSYVLHGVTPVTEGVRHSLVGWITGPRFK